MRSEQTLLPEGSARSSGSRVRRPISTTRLRLKYGTFLPPFLGSLLPAQSPYASSATVLAADQGDEEIAAGSDRGSSQVPGSADSGTTTTSGPAPAAAIARRSARS